MRSLSGFSLVVGYLPGLDRRPSPLRTHPALSARRTLVLYPDEGRLPASAQALLAALLADLPDAAQAMALLRPGDAPEAVWLGPPANPAAYVNATDWTAGGGPLPYHDGLVIEAYTAPFEADALVVRVLQAGTAAGAVPLEIRRGEARPQRRWGL